MKWECKDKLEMVLNYKKGITPPNSSRVLKDNIRNWNKLYDLFGIAGLEHNIRHWNIEDKLRSIKLINEGYAYREVSRMFNMKSCSVIQNWHRRYLESGIDGLKYEGRGRPRKMRRKPLKKKVNKSLAAEIVELRKQLEYAEAENAYLKKLAALVQKRKAQEQKKK